MSIVREEQKTKFTLWGMNIKLTKEILAGEGFILYAHKGHHRKEMKTSKVIRLGSLHTTLTNCNKLWRND